MANTIIRVAKNPTSDQIKELTLNNAAPLTTTARLNGEEFPVVVFQSTWKWNPCQSITEQIVFSQDIDNSLTLHPIVRDYLNYCGTLVY